MRSRIKYGVFGLLLVFNIACAGSKSALTGDKLPRVKDEILLKTLDSLHKQRVNFFYTKIGTQYKDSTRSNNFKTSVRMRCDSALNALITFANVPIVNSLVTVDSVFISNRKDKCYSKQSMTYFKELLGVDFNLRTIEELLLGLPVGFDASHRYEQIDRDELYVVSSHKKREIKRNERKDERELITMYGLSPDLKSLNKIMIESPADTAIIEINYLEREFVDSLSVPKDALITILTARNRIEIKLEYSKTRIDETEEIYFVIPEEYGPCE